MLTYDHTQSEAAAIWTIDHNLDLTSLMIEVFIDLGGKPAPIIPSKITKTSSNQVVIVFSTPRAGIAHLVGSSGVFVDYSNYTPPVEREIDYTFSPKE